MLSYDQALEQILAAVVPLSEEEAVPLVLADERALVKDVYAPLSLPPFDNSAVDGFAVQAKDTRLASPQNPIRLPVIETIAAGSVPTQTLQPGQAARILTGAPLPQGADALVMVEDTKEVNTNTVEILLPGSAGFIRRAGSDLSQGDLALSKGNEIDAGTIALLAALGFQNAPCARRPRVAVLTTGDEIYQGTGALSFGNIHDANGPALVAAVQKAGGIVPDFHQHIADDLNALRDALRLVRDYDVVLTSGGVSVGQYDFVKTAIEEIGSLDFWRVAIKPGKPLAFGHLGKALFFGLPGNPVSSLVTFELFVRPALRKLAGYSQLLRPLLPIILGEALPHLPGRREFARARLRQETKGGRDLRAYPLGAQDSHRLSSLASADVLLIAHEGHADYKVGETLPAMLLN